MKRFLLPLILLLLFAVPSASAEDQQLTPEETVEIHQFIDDMPTDTLAVCVEELLKLDEPDHYDEESLAVAAEALDKRIWLSSSHKEDIYQLAEDANYDEESLDIIRETTKVDPNQSTGFMGLIAIVGIVIVIVISLSFPLH